MLVMNDCAIEPGDILFVVSNSKKPLVLLKQAAQSLITSRNSKHGHREAISVFVCTGKNKYGVICHNFERKLSLSTKSFTNNLKERSLEELSIALLNYCTKEFTSSQIKETLMMGPRWMKQLTKGMKGDENTEELVAQFLTAIKENRKKIIKLLNVFWHASGQAETLPAVNSSLLLFKHTDGDVRQKFLAAYLEQVKLTEKLHAQGKTRTSIWALLRSLFRGSTQDSKDRKKSSPSEATYCSRNLMEILNQVDPNLVNRGRHVLPKSLEAGLREATKRKNLAEDAVNQQPFEDFEDMIAAQEQLLPPFTLQILPASGRKFVNTLLAVIDNEIERIENKWWINKADKQKASDLKKLLSPFRDPKFQTYSVDLQIDVGLEIIATLLPTLKRKTGLLGEWFPSTSYSKVRAFARTQGIFDGDVREAIEKLKNKPTCVVEENKQEAIPDEIKHSNLGKIYIFADWSFSSWSANKRELLLEHMIGLLAAGNALYTWENGQLIKMNKSSLQNAIHGEDFDDLLVPKLRPASRFDLTQQAEQQQLDIKKLEFLDYKGCQNLMDDGESFQVKLNNVAPLFSTKLDDYHLAEIKQEIIDIELANAGNNPLEKVALQQLKEQIEAHKNVNLKTYHSGVDTKASVAQPQFRKPVFKPVDLTTFTPSSKYYRNEVYSDLIINKTPSSPFQYFELRGMNATEHLISRKYHFHPKGLTKNIIKKRREESPQTLFEGEKSFNLTKDWQALPSLDPNETLLDIALKGLKKDDFEIQYARENHLYYIRSKNPRTNSVDTTINMLLRMPQHFNAKPLFNTLAADPEHPEIHRLLMKYLKFGRDNGKLRNAIGVTLHNGQEYLDEARKLSVASCRLRAIAFKEEMQCIYPEIPVSIVVNPDHCFIEMMLDGKWQRYCLGGYRDTPSLIESVVEDSLTFGSLQQRFFTEKTLKPQQNFPQNAITSSM